MEIIIVLLFVIDIITLVILFRFVSVVQDILKTMIGEQ